MRQRSAKTALWLAIVLLAGNIAAIAAPTETVMIPAADGVDLSTDIYRPANGKAPVILLTELATAYVAALDARLKQWRAIERARAVYSGILSLCATRQLDEATKEMANLKGRDVTELAAEVRWRLERHARANAADLTSQHVRSNLTKARHQETGPLEFAPCCACSPGPP